MVRGLHGDINSAGARIDIDNGWDCSSLKGLELLLVERKLEER
jgi:hypothetical protein